jgi:RNA polymerase sigma factor (sigma-70 family)
MPGASPNPEEADESLMLRYGAGDVSAFDMLYSRHEMKVWRYVFRSVRNAAVADDLLQDVWFAVVRQAANYQAHGRSAGPPQASPTPSGGSAAHEVASVGAFTDRAGPPQASPDPSGGSAAHEVASVGASFKTWLFTIAHHRVIDHFRTAKHHASLDEGGDSDDGDRSLLETLAADSGFGPVRQLQSRQAATALLEAVEQLPQSQRDAFLLQAEGDLSVEDIAAATGTRFETAKSRLRYARQSLRQSLKEFA